MLSLHSNLRNLLQKQLKASLCLEIPQMNNSKSKAASSRYMQKRGHGGFCYLGVVFQRHIIISAIVPASASF